MRFPQLIGQLVGNGGEHGEDDDSREDGGGDVGQVGAQHGAGQDDDQAGHHTTKRSPHLRIMLSDLAPFLKTKFVTPRMEGGPFYWAKQIRAR